MKGLVRQPTVKHPLEPETYIQTIQYKTTPGTFVLDRLKGLGLAILLGAPLLAGILALFQYTTHYAWLYCWLVVTVFSLFIQLVAPTWIMPLFNKFTPIESGELKEAILRLSKNKELRTYLGKEAKKLAEETFEAKIVSNVLYKYLVNL